MNAAKFALIVWCLLLAFGRLLTSRFSESIVADRIVTRLNSNFCDTDRWLSFNKTGVSVFRTNMPEHT